MTQQQKEAYAAGLKAGKEKLPVGDNPYPEDDTTHWQWYRGYMAGWKARVVMEIGKSRK